MDNDSVYQTPKSDLETEHGETLEYAGFWVRAFASIIDTILILLVTWPLLTAIYGTSYWESEATVNGAWDVVLTYLAPAVAVIVFWIYKSATPGKMVLGLKVISLGDSEKLSVGQSIGRYLAYYLAMIPFFLGFIWVAFDPRKQGWHDKLAKTVVVKVR